jgi:hypothetical protein
LEAVHKRLIMLGLLIAVAAAAFGLACTGFGADFGIAVTCDKAGAVGMIQALLMAVMANQATYQISPKK